MNVKTIIENCLNACLQREKAMRELNIPLANKLYDQIFEYYSQLKKKGALEEFRPLLCNPNPSVKLMAATHLLSIDEMVAKEVITQLMESERGEIRFTAEMILKEWDKGNMENYK
jgi:hypothetical protein